MRMPILNVCLFIQSVCSHERSTQILILLPILGAASIGGRSDNKREVDSRVQELLGEFDRALRFVLAVLGDSSALQNPSLTQFTTAHSWVVGLA